MGTEMSVTEVAYAAGFSDSSYFIQCFRKYEGIETLTNSWFYGEWIVKIIAKVMILIINFVLHKKRRETMKDDKKEKSEQRYTERIRLIKDRVVNTRPEMDLEKAKAFRRQCREKTVKIWDQELIVGCSGMIMKQRMR